MGGRLLPARSFVILVGLLFGRASGNDAWLSGKVAVVTGGGSGIGLAYARSCLRAGSSVVLSDGNPELLERACDELRGEGNGDDRAGGLGVGGGAERLLGVVADVRDGTAVEALKEKCLERFGRVDLVFSNAGVIGEPDKGVQATSEGACIARAGLNSPPPSKKSWRLVLDTNVMGLVHAIHAFVPAMEAQGGECHFVATASGAGIYSQHRTTMGPYVASKHCAVVVAQALRTELEARGSNVRAHAVCPSVVATPLVRTTRFFYGTEGEGMDETSRHFDGKLNSDGMPPERVAELALLGVREGRFFVITHPKVTRQRVEARASEILAAIDEQPETGY